MSKRDRSFDRNHKPFDDDWDFGPSENDRRGRKGSKDARREARRAAERRREGFVDRDSRRGF